MKSKVFDIVSKVLEVPVESIRDDTRPPDVETWDSMRHMVMLMAAEEQFDCVFSDREMVSIGSVGDLVALVETHLSP